LRDIKRFAETDFRQIAADELTAEELIAELQENGNRIFGE